ncbi:MAG: hypothetical protein J3Q66DRAFT_344448 [Benniella sp.]|nr:MAG: hypothetical protein J3Q66DRAFT_344448 [Benniella sp.]
MMYMVKYGARVGGSVVPPLLGLNRAIEDKGDKNHLQFIKKDFSRLVDDTIAYLQGAIGSLEVDTPTPRNLDTKDLNEMKSHLNVKEWQHIQGGLSSMMFRVPGIQSLHFTSVCSDHLRDCYASALQQLRLDIVNVPGGIWDGIDVSITATSEAMAKLSKDPLGKLLKIQGMEYWPCLTEITMIQNCSHPASKPTMDIFGSLNNLDYISLDIGRLWMTTNDISQGDINNSSIGIPNLKDLTLEDLEIIRQYRPIALTISKTPEKEDEDRLVSILHQNPSITFLRIQCHLGRHSAIINLVISTREKMRRSRSRPESMALRLLDSKLPGSAKEAVLERASGPHCLFHQSSSGNVVDVSFDKVSSTVGVRTHLRSNQFKSDDPEVHDFIRQFGYSFITLVVPESFSDPPAMLLDECTGRLTSSIAHLEITPTSLTTAGLDAMDRVINRSKGLTYLRLSLKSLRQVQQLEKALLLLERYKDRVTSIHMSDWYEDSCLAKIKRVLPDRSRFPRLEEFSVDCINWDHGPRGTARQWIISMISAQTQHPTLPLKVLGVKIDLWPQDWESVIKAIDLSTLEELHIDNCNFSQVQLKLLADRIADSKTLLPLKLLNLKGSKAEKVGDTVATRAMMARIRQRAPQVVIEGQFKPLQ